MWLMPTSLGGEVRYLSTGRKCQDVDRRRDEDLGTTTQFTMGTLASTAEGCSYLLLESVGSYEMLSQPPLSGVRICIISLQRLPPCPLVINLPNTTHLERSNDVHKPRSNTRAHHADYSPTKPCQDREYDL